MTSALERAPPLQVIVDGAFIIESDLECNKDYLSPEIFDIKTKPSAISSSSSLCAETGAPDIRHLVALAATNTDEEEPRPSGILVTSDAAESRRHQKVSQTGVGGHGALDCTELLASDVQDDQTSHTSLPVKIIPTTGEQFEVVSVASLPTKIIHTSGEKIDDMSSVTMNENFSIHPSVLDFSLSLMPELTPRRKPLPGAGSKERQRMGLSIVATSPSEHVGWSRYRRPTDSLLLRNGHDISVGPSPIATHAKSKHSCASDPPLLRLNRAISSTSDVRMWSKHNDPQALKQLRTTHSVHGHLRVQTESPMQEWHTHQCDIGRSTRENFDPQSPRMNRQKKGIGSPGERIRAKTTTRNI
ncbi:hypothetical protein ACHAWF_018578 [Thalassiosira exigua]